jgi:tetratricopeptide (TPR) repeat protein
MESIEQKWLSVFDDLRFKDMKEETSSPNEIITNFLLKDKINLESFTANLLYLQTSMPQFYMGEYIPTKSAYLLLTSSNLYPKWFTAAYPDVLRWIEIKIEESEDNFFKITETTDEYYSNESNFINYKFDLKILSTICKNYLIENNQFECANTQIKNETLTGSSWGDSFMSNKTKALFLVDEGDVALINNELDKAISNYNRAIEYYPEAKAFYKRGDIYFRKQLYEEAVKDFNSAIKLDHSLAIAYFARGIIRLDFLDLFSEGCSDIKKAGELGVVEAVELYKNLSQ